MFNYFDGLGAFSIMLAMTTIATIVTFALFFLRLVVFYKKGVIYASKNTKIPQLADVHLIFFSIGILTPLLLSCIPFLGFAALIISIIAFLKTMPEILKIDNPAKIKPEKLAFIAIGLGIAGLIGFLLGFYRGSSFKDEVENVQDTTILNNKSE